jgi:hypothetical protein
MKGLLMGLAAVLAVIVGSSEASASLLPWENASKTLSTPTYYDVIGEQVVRF